MHIVKRESQVHVLISGLFPFPPIDSRDFGNLSGSDHVIEELSAFIKTKKFLVFVVSEEILETYV